MSLLGINSVVIAGEICVDVTTDLSGLGYPYGNAAGDGITDDANAINWALPLTMYTLAPVSMRSTMQV